MTRLRRVEFELLRRGREGRRRVKVWQVERRGDFLDFGWVLEEGDDFHGTAALIADEGGDLVDPFDKRGPCF